MLYRDSAEAGEKRTNEERGEAENKAIISSLNSIEISENVSDDGKRYLSRHTVCPKSRSVTGPDAHYSLICGEKLPRAKQKQKTEKEKKQHE